MTPRILLTVITVPDCEPCKVVQDMVESFLADNRSLTIEVNQVDGIDDADALIASRAMAHPTLILGIDGEEKARLVGPVSIRKVLRSLLPALYHDDRVALAQLRRQLGSPTETFPSGPLRGRVRQAERVALVRNVPMFEGLSKRQTSHLARLTDEIHRDEGAVLIEEGDAGDEFFIVVAGAVNVLKTGAKVAALSTGDHFGEMSLLDRLPRSATVVTTAASTLLVMHRDDFDRYLMRTPTVMRALLANMSERLRNPT